MDPAQLRSLFLEESREHLAAAMAILRDLGGRAAGAEESRELLRHAHSLKGMAATMGFGTMADLAHAIEDRVQALSPSTAESSEVELLRASLDALARIIDRIQNGASPEDPISGTLAGSLRAGGAMTTWRLELELAPLAASAHVQVVHGVVDRLASLGHVFHASARAAWSGSERAAALRVLLASPVEPARIDGLMAELAGVASWRRQEAPGPSWHAAPAARGPEWVRVRAEQLDYLQDRSRALAAEAARLRVAGLSAHGLERIVAELRHGIRDLDLLPFETVRFRLERGVAEVALRLDRPARLEIENGGVVLERRILDAITEPLLHVVRNAVDHGVEPAAERARRGKPSEGRIRVRLTHHPRRLTIEVADDGRGLDPDQLRRLAVERGLISSAAASCLGDREALQLVTGPGFSTADRLSLSSGRGMGLNIVAEAMARLGGTVEIESAPSEGASIVLRVPASRTRVPVLRVQDAGESFLLPLASVLRVEGPLVLASDDSTWRRVDLVAPRSDSAGAAARRPRVLARGAGGPIAIGVDEILGVLDPVIDPLPPPLTDVAPFSGASILSDGTIALVVEPAQL